MKMASKANKKLNTQKLLPKQGRVEKLKKDAAPSKVTEVPDIEDACSNIRSPYFSPLQTRQQRKVKQSSLAEDVKCSDQSEKTLKADLIKQTEEHPVVELKKRFAGKPDTPRVTSSWEPENWQTEIENIKIMRARSVAPVDLMGCDKCSDEYADEKTQRFQKLVALMLSSQTKDETTFAAMQRLRSHTLTPHSIVEMKTTQLEELLCPVSFYKVKAKHLQQTARVLIDKYNSDIPNNLKELIALHGVGSKMAHICMAVAWDKVTGIGVDVHVHRIANRLRWVQHETKEPENTRVALEKWLPRALWKEVNHLLVGFGQVICTPRSPHCGQCLNRNICPSAEVVKKKSKKEKNQ